MKKGFTLIELIAIIAILGIIAAIMLPQIQGFLSRSQEKNYELTVSKIITEAQAYVDDNNLATQVTALNYLDIPLSTLVDENYINIKDLADPRKKDALINKDVSFVRVTLEEGTLVYTPYFTN